ncbi:MAG: UDP-2,3-diacylglucosamine diphosphatase, partial [Bacteroidales bacterium]|nr:UDP-2,3-diacylglucosamine diphosphatase [Bacteroidales bacterium]
AKNKNKTTPHDIYIFGHRHIPEVLNIDNNTKYVNLGDWISHNTYGILENGKFSLNSFKD